VLVMTVNPGFAGQAMIAKSLDKIKNLRTYLDDNGYQNMEIEVDGNVSFANAKQMYNAGANIFATGLSSIFDKSHLLRDNIKMFRNVISEVE